jgi:mRNA interferase RelE/StbE
MYSIELTRQAEKNFSQLMKSNPTIGKRVAHAIDGLAEDPEKGVPLRGELKGLFKYRVGSYRIIYEIKKQKLLITVIDIGHRREVYR